MRSTTLLFLFMTGAIGCADRVEESTSAAASKRTVTILAAASLLESLEKVAEQIESQHAQIDIVISGGPSNGLASQVLAGADAELFFSASRKWADEIDNQGFAAEVVDVLSNKLVLIAPKGNPAGIQSMNDLTSNKLRHVALAGENVPAGTYATQALEKLGMLETLTQSNRIVRGNDVRAALAFVERGEAEAGIVYATDAEISKEVEIVSDFDPTTHDPIVYSLVLLRRQPDRETDADSRTVFQAIQSDASLTIFESFGFTRSRQLDSPGTAKP